MMPDGHGNGDLPVAGHISIPPSPEVAAWHDPIGHPIARAVRRGIEEFRPDVALLWPGTESVAFTNEFPPSVADRIDCSTLTSWRHARFASGAREKARSLRDVLSYARYERTVVRHMAATVVVGDDDADALRRIAGANSIHVVENGVEIDFGASAGERSAQPTVAFSGTLNYPPNVDAIRFLADSIWPRVLAAVPDAELMIIGRSPFTDLLDLSGRTGVKIVPDVPDMGVALARAWVAVAPMKTGSGVKNKVLESWATGLPVVMTTLATNGLRTDPNSASLITDSPARFADLVIALLKDDRERERLGAAARELAREHSWRRSGERLTQILRAALGS